MSKAKDKRPLIKLHRLCYKRLSMTKGWWPLPKITPTRQSRSLPYFLQIKKETQTKATGKIRNGHGSNCTELSLNVCPLQKASGPSPDFLIMENKKWQELSQNQNFHLQWLQCSYRVGKFCLWHVQVPGNIKVVTFIQAHHEE